MRYNGTRPVTIASVTGQSLQLDQPQVTRVRSKTLAIAVAGVFPVLMILEWEGKGKPV
jgi:hypothetical protein